MRCRARRARHLLAELLAELEKNGLGAVRDLLHELWNAWVVLAADLDGWCRESSGSQEGGDGDERKLHLDGCIGCKWNLVLK